MELRSPIRLYWDITPLPSLPPDYERLCAEIATSRALTLDITDSSESLSDITASIINRLATSSMAISLTLARTALAQALPLIERGGVRKLVADVATFEGLAELLQRSQKVNDRLPYGISWRVSRENSDTLPDLLEWCLEHGVSELVLPMERLTQGAETFCLGRDEHERLARRIARVPFNGKLTITVHDPFLWRAVYPDVPFPGGVCQAANTMLYIDPKGDVYPCPAMPVLLGSLIDRSFRDIVSSEAKREVRRRIVTLPSGCAACGLQAECRGGCRGRGYAGKESWDDADPGCGV